MTAAQRNRLRKLLLALREELSGKAPRRIEPNRTDDARVGGDEDEQPLNEMLQAIASNRNRSNEVVLARIDQALRKLDEAPDDYGACEECGEDISIKRLEKMPYAELCIECQAQRDGPRGAPTRKKVTDFR